MPKKVIKKVVKKVIKKVEVKPIATKKLPIKWKGNRVVEESYKGNFTRGEVRNAIQNKSNELKDDFGFEGKLEIAIKYDGIGWISGYWTNVGDDVVLPNLDSYDVEDKSIDTEKINQFHVYYMKDAPNAGGCDGSFNDCLYYCLKKALGEHNWFENGYKLKQFLKLKRKDKVPIERIKKLEDDQRLESFKINVEGDHIYTSTKNANRVINLKLVDGHYTLKANNKVKVRGIAHEEKVPLFHRNMVNGKYSVYDKESGERTMTVQEFDMIKKNPLSSPYILMPSDKRYEGNFQLENEEFERDAELLKKETEGRINLFKTGRDVKTAINLFNYFNQTLSPEPISQTEGEYLNKASFAALIWADKYEGCAYKYDVTSHYPALMSHQLMFFPIKAGTFKNITQEEFDALERLPYGVYRSVIKIESNLVYKHFRNNPLNYYTHIDLAVAKELKLKVTMIQDSQPNQLMYNRSDMVTGSQLFKPYCEYMFKLKDKTVNRAKTILNVLWGALTQKNVLKKMVCTNSKEELEIRGDRTIERICPTSDDEVAVEFYKNESMYETNYGRIAPFILARGRQLIRNFIKTNMDNVVRVHTDGWIQKNEGHKNTSTKMGEVKYEGYCEHVVVQNNIKIQGNFII